MADDEYSRSSAGDDDFDEPEEDNGIDNEGTLDEEEAFEEGDYSNELKDLEEEGEMDIEELRRRYNLPIADSDSNMPSEGCSSSYDDTGAVQNSLLADEEEGEEEEDKDYIPSDPYRKEIRVDEDLYQAQIPEIGSPEIEHPVAEPLWQPTDKLTDEEINSFVQKIVEIRGSLPVQVVPEQRYSLKRDDEDSLCALYRANYDVKKAEENYPFPRVNQPVRSVRPEALEWDNQEQQAFEDAFSQVGKDFNLIRQAGNLLYRPIGELIDYYYKWKKTDRYQKFKIEQIRKTADEEYRQFTEKMLSTSPPPAKKVYLDHPDHFNPHPQPGTP